MIFGRLFFFYNSDEVYFFWFVLTCHVGLFVNFRFGRPKLLGNDKRRVKIFQCAFQDGTVTQSENVRFPEMEMMGSTSSVETLPDSMLNSKDKVGSHLIKGIQAPLLSTGTVFFSFELRCSCPQFHFHEISRTSCR